MKKSLLAILLAVPFGLVYGQNSIAVGSMSNCYSMLRGEQNQAFVDNDLGVVGLIHRNDINLHGGSSGNLRYCVSVDGGSTFSTHIGVLNNNLTRLARYPNMAVYNPTGNTDTANAYLVWAAPTLASTWNGHVNGTAQFTSGSTPTTTENYQFDASNTLLPGGLTESVSGTYWLVEFNYDTVAAAVTDSINLYKGTFGGGDVTWVHDQYLVAPHSRSFDGAAHSTGPNIAFSPDGQTGYIVFLGDINAADSTYNPIYYKSTDGGTTWGSANELIIDNINGVGDTLSQYLFDTGTDIVYVSEVATSFDFDVTVDATGNLHLLTSVMCVEMRDTNEVVINPKQYSVYSGMPKYVADIYTTDGGTTWTHLYVSQQNALRTTVGGTSVDNYHQISRTPDGTKIFFSWADSDTLIYSGITANDFPNVRIAGFRPADGYRTCWKRIEGVANEDFVITPTMAPTVIENVTSPQYTMAIFSQEILIDDLSQTNLHYMGPTANFCDEDFMDPSTMDLSFTFTSQCYYYTSCFAASIDDEETINFNLYPNPTYSDLNITVDDVNSITSMNIVNNMGQIVRVMSNNLPNGNNMVNINVADLAAGMYTLNLVSDNKTYSKKFTVVK